MLNTADLLKKSPSASSIGFHRSACNLCNEYAFPILFSDATYYKRSNVTEFVIRRSLAAPSSMTANTGLLLVISFGLSFVIGDHNHGYEAAYVYPEPDLYTNTSGLTYQASSGRTRYSLCRVPPIIIILLVLGGFSMKKYLLP